MVRVVEVNRLAQYLPMLEDYFLLKNTAMKGQARVLIREHRRRGLKLPGHLKKVGNEVGFIPFEVLVPSL